MSKSRVHQSVAFFQVLPSWVGSWPYHRTWDMARKACKGIYSNVYGFVISDKEKRFITLTPGVSLAFFIAENAARKARAFVPGKPLQHSVIFVNMSRVYQPYPIIVPGRKGLKRLVSLPYVAPLCDKDFLVML